MIASSRQLHRLTERMLGHPLLVLPTVDHSMTHGIAHTPQEHEKCARVGCLLVSTNVNKLVLARNVLKDLSKCYVSVRFAGAHFVAMELLELAARDDVDSGTSDNGSKAAASQPEPKAPDHSDLLEPGLVLRLSRKALHTRKLFA